METATPAVSPVDPKFLVAYRKLFRLEEELGVCNAQDEKLRLRDDSPETVKCAAKRTAARDAIEDRWGKALSHFEDEYGTFAVPDSKEFRERWDEFAKSEHWPAVEVRPAHRPVSEFTNEGWIKSRLADVYELPDVDEFLTECEVMGIKKEHARVYLGRMGFARSKEYVRARPIEHAENT